MVRGEQVRVAGANVGEVESVGVTMPGEISSYEDGEPEAVPGKAVIVMKITDPGFQDFRERRHLPHPPAVADRREVRRLPPDPAAGAGHRAAAAS